MLSVTFDRTRLGLEPLVIDNDPYDGDFFLTEKDCTWAEFGMRRTYAPDSETVAGKQMLAATQEQGSVQLGFLIHGADMAAAKAAMEELTAATTQFSYVLTLVVNGLTMGAWNADPETPKWGVLDSGDVKASMVKGTIAIPINPPGSP